MSEFGDNTPKQDMLEWLNVVRRNHKLSWFAFLQALAEVLAYFIELARFESEP